MNNYISTIWSDYVEYMYDLECIPYSEYNLSSSFLFDEYINSI